ncbi:hypothetical protein AB0K53_11980 [Streptomyces tuirus]
MNFEDVALTVAGSLPLVGIVAFACKDAAIRMLDALTDVRAAWRRFRQK